jgi:hypothetical protein
VGSSEANRQGVGRQRPRADPRRTSNGVSARYFSQSICRSLFAEEILEVDLSALRAATNGGFALGSDRFQLQIATVGPRTWSVTCRRPKKERRAGIS